MPSPLFPSHAPLAAAGGPERGRKAGRKTRNSTGDSELKCTAAGEEQETEDNRVIKTAEKGDRQKEKVMGKRKAS